MNPENEAVENENIDYINTINELKANTVDKAKYDKLKEENKQLLQTLVDGGQIEQPKKDVDVEQLRKDLFRSDHLTNLDYCEKLLKLREAIMEKGDRDPFLPSGKNVRVEDSDIVAAERVAQSLRECIDYADGDSNIFTMELQRRMVDTPVTRRK